MAERLPEERESVGRAPAVREVLGIAGRYADPAGESDVATRHDEALDDERPPGRRRGESPRWMTPSPGKDSV